MTIVGDGELRDVIKNDIDRRGLGDCIHLVGTRSSAEIRQFLLGARAFVLPSFAEGLPVVIMEALAMARPVITTAIAGIPGTGRQRMWLGCSCWRRASVG